MEFAGVDKAARSKMGVWKMQEWTYRHDMARVDIEGMDNAALLWRGWTMQEELDGQGKARREAARRRNSECKINFNSRNSSRSNGSRPTAYSER